MLFFFDNCTFFLPTIIGRSIMYYTDDDGLVINFGTNVSVSSLARNGGVYGFWQKDQREIRIKNLK